MNASSDAQEPGTDASAEAPPTVRERLRAARVSDQRVHDHFEARAIQLDGVVISDLDQSAAYGSRIVFTGR